MIKVVNKRTHKPTPNDVYIGRPSKWGNPFIVGRHGTREEVIDKYRKWIETTNLPFQVGELQDKTLVCWCKPHACHGDVLKQLVEED